MKASFLRRLGAYIIDILLISLITTIFTTIIPYSNTLEEKNEKLSQLPTKLLNNEITIDQYKKEATDLTYDVEKDMFIYTVFNITIILLYFVIYQHKNKQTIGKRIMNIKITNININTLLIRSLIINGITLNLLTVLLILIQNKTLFFNTYMTVSTIQGFVIIISAFMIMFREDKRGIHDLIAKTEVVRG